MRVRERVRLRLRVKVRRRVETRVSLKVSLYLLPANGLILRKTQFRIVRLSLYGKE